MGDINETAEARQTPWCVKGRGGRCSGRRRRIRRARELARNQFNCLGASGSSRRRPARVCTLFRPLVKSCLASCKRDAHVAMAT
jgi:hypothetical protein